MSQRHVKWYVQCVLRFDRSLNPTNYDNFISYVKLQIKHAKWKEQNLIHSRQVQQLRKENPHIVYGLGYTSLFRHISKTVMDRFRNYRYKINEPATIENQFIAY